MAQQQHQQTPALPHQPQNQPNQQQQIGLVGGQSQQNKFPMQNGEATQQPQSIMPVSTKH